MQGIQNNHTILNKERKNNNNDKNWKTQTSQFHILLQSYSNKILCDGHTLVIPAEEWRVGGVPVLYSESYSNQDFLGARCQWLTPVILAT
jgi:hypothetical protein